MSQERKLTLRIDATQVEGDLKKAFDRAMKGGTSTTTAKAKGSSGMFGGNDKILKSLGKLALIAAAVTAILKSIEKIADRIVDSSPILQTMLKLMQTGITFILRPIGDFIGFFLRPFMIFFLRSIALPMYQQWGPVMRELGRALGQGLFGPRSSPVGEGFGVTTPLFNVGPAIDDMLKTWIEGSLAKLPNFDNVTNQFEALKRKLSNFAVTLPENIRPFKVSILQVWEGLKVFVGLVGLKISQILSGVLPVFGGIAMFFENVLATVSDVFSTTIVPKLTEFSNFITLLIEQARAPVESAIASIGAFFNDLAEFFINLIESINGLIASIPSAIAGIGGNVAAGATTVTQNFFEGAIQSGQDVVDQIFNFGSEIQKNINASLSGRTS